jgi:hypothetical protein
VSCSLLIAHPHPLSLSLSLSHACVVRFTLLFARPSTCSEPSRERLFLEQLERIDYSDPFLLTESRTAALSPAAGSSEDSTSREVQLVSPLSVAGEPSSTTAEARELEIAQQLEVQRKRKEALWQRVSEQLQ